MLSFTFNGTIQMEQIGLYWRLCIIIYVLWCHISASVIFFVMKSHFDVRAMCVIQDGINTTHIPVHVYANIYIRTHFRRIGCTHYEFSLYNRRQTCHIVAITCWCKMPTNAWVQRVSFKLFQCITNCYCVIISALANLKIDSFTWSSLLCRAVLSWVSENGCTPERKLV